MENKFIIAKTGGVGRMKLFNEIDNSGYSLDRFLLEFEALQQDESIDEIEVLINSLGGSVYKGMPIVTAIANSGKPVITIVDTVAASMAAMIFLAGHKRKMNSYAQVMIHSARYEDGHEDEALKNVNDNIFNIIKAVTRRAKDRIKGWLSKDSWFTAKQALQEGLATEIIKTRLSLVDSFQTEVRNMVASAASMDAINNLKNKHEKMDNIYSLLDLSAEASEQAVEAKVKEIKNALEIKTQELINRESKIKELETSLKVFEDAKAEAKANEINKLIDEAFKNRQINAEGKATWQQLLIVDFESASKAIKALAKTEKISEIINTDSEKRQPEMVLSPLQQLMENPF